MKLFLRYVQRERFSFPSFPFVARHDDVMIVQAVQSEALFLQIAFGTRSPSTFNSQPNSRGYKRFPLVLGHRQIHQHSFSFSLMQFLLSRGLVASVPTWRRRDVVPRKTLNFLAYGRRQRQENRLDRDCVYERFPSVRLADDNKAHTPTDYIFCFRAGNKQVKTWVIDIKKG